MSRDAINHHCPFIRSAIKGLISWGVNVALGGVPLDFHDDDHDPSSLKLPRRSSHDSGPLHSSGSR